MAQQPPRNVYVPGQGLATEEEARTQTRTTPFEFFEPPPPSVPRPGEQPIESQLLAGAPQLVALLAALAGAGIPLTTALTAGTDLFQQALTEGTVDPLEAATTGVTSGAGPGIAGKVTTMLGRRTLVPLGRSIARRGLLGGQTTIPTLSATGIEESGGGRMTARMANRLAETLARERVPLTDAGVDILKQRWNTLRDAAPQSIGPAREAITRRLADLEALIPVVSAAVDRAATAGSGVPRFAAGAGITAGLATPTAMAAGLDPATAGMVGLAAGLPVGISQASPRAAAGVGRRMMNAPEPLGSSLEMIIRSLLAGLAIPRGTPPSSTLP